MTAKTIIDSAKVEVEFLKLIYEDKGTDGVMSEATKTKFLTK